MNIDTNIGTNIDTNVDTKAPTWLLLRGLTRDARHWGAFAARFAQAMGGARVVALDLPGNGALNLESSPTRIDAMAEHCRAQRHRLGIDGPCRVLAMSLGAMVAAAWAARHPQEIESLVLINSSMRPVSAFHERLRPHHYFRLLRLLIARAGAADWERTIFEITSRRSPDGHGVDRDAVCRAWVAYRLERPVAARNALRQLLAAARFRAPESLQRVLLLASACDALVAPSCSQALARRWGAPLAMHPWAGHDLPLDDGAWVIEQVQAWLARR
jgi:pimeloyl-ACP methyl ester carboxylesterase